jgi:hypothetical protein
MSFQISSLASARFSHLFGKSEEELHAAGIIVKTADSKPGFPCRVTLRDAEPGTRLLLLNYEHQSAATPYRSSHAIFVIDGAKDASLEPGEIPEQLRSRLLSVRAFSEDGMILDANVVEGAEAADLFERMLRNKRAAYLHVHFAKFGCYAARVDRVA